RGAGHSVAATMETAGSKIPSAARRSAPGGDSPLPGQLATVPPFYRMPLAPNAASNAERTIIISRKVRMTYDRRLCDSPDISVWIPRHIGTVEIAPCAVNGVMIGVFS